MTARRAERDVNIDSWTLSHKPTCRVVTRGNDEGGQWAMDSHMTVHCPLSTAHYFPRSKNDQYIIRWSFVPARTIMRRAFIAVYPRENFWRGAWVSYARPAYSLHYPLGGRFSGGS